MYDQQAAKRILQRLTEIRTGILREYPFFGTLLMHLRFGIANCGTAFTDMKRIVFDPEFVEELDDEQLEFIMLHEVMHCVLNHCIRGQELDHMIFNIACDVVVNSNIMQTMGVTEFKVAGEPAMHLTPLGDEGYKYTAEEVYQMYVKQCNSSIQTQGMPLGDEKGNGIPTSDPGNGDMPLNGFSLDDFEAKTVDNHEPWQKIPLDGPIKDEWNNNITKISGKYAGGPGIPPAIRELLKDLDYRSKVNWKVLLREFISQNYDEYDYTYNPPDRRYIEYDIYLQSFRMLETDKVENVWFCVDTSGSITNETLNLIFSEIKQAVYQWRGLSGKVSFFDTTVSEPKLFSDIYELEAMEAVGGGGTSFYEIFHYMEREMMSDLPRGIVILTDGYAAFPPEEVSFGIPVLWLIIDSNRKAPWGTCVQIASNDVS